MVNILKSTGQRNCEMALRNVIAQKGRDFAVVAAHLILAQDDARNPPTAFHDSNKDLRQAIKCVFG